METVPRWGFWREKPTEKMSVQRMAMYLVIGWALQSVQESVSTSGDCSAKCSVHQMEPQLEASKAQWVNWWGSMWEIE